MARTPRGIVLNEEAGGVYHCINRCVRRAFLCGEDEVSGKSFEHRREWIRRRLEFLAGEFAVDVLGYAVLSNHLHAVLRTRPDVVSGWSDDEVARHWWRLFPWRREADGSPAEMRPDELRGMLADSAKLTEWRKRLASVSWFMRCLAEPIARQANREDECTGRFWEGRFKCQPLLDEAALLACCVYVDLNPIRAGIAKTPESSKFTSAFDRIQALKNSVVEADSAKKTRKSASRGDHASSQSSSTQSSASATASDGWLSPIELARDLDECSAGESKVTVTSSSKSAKTSTRATHRRTPEERLRRASSKGFLPMTLADYLSLLDWTGRQLRREKRGAIPAEMQPLFARLKISGEGWFDLIQDFSRLFRRAAGRPESLATEAARRDRRWLHGITSSRALFA